MKTTQLLENIYPVVTMTIEACLPGQLELLAAIIEKTSKIEGVTKGITNQCSLLMRVGGTFGISDLNQALEDARFELKNMNFDATFYTPISIDSKIIEVLLKVSTYEDEELPTYDYCTGTYYMSGTQDIFIYENIDDSLEDYDLAALERMYEDYMHAMSPGNF
ncbi:MAG: hypothetical protein JHC33_03390 [Ignisphaera sp.]|nr:hypothetical protein [Ignisphaera sp.]